MSVIYNLFKWFVSAIGDIVTLIIHIPTYITSFIGLVTSYIPAPVGIIFLLCISAYAIIHIKRLVF